MLSAYKNHLEELSSPQILIFLHHNADPDAIGAAFAFSELSISINKNTRISIHSDGQNQTSKKAMKSMNLSIDEEIPDTDETALIVNLDTANIIQLGKYQEWVFASKLKRMVIDHHSTKELAEGTQYSVLDPESGSTCIIIAKIFHSMNIIPSKQSATLMIMGHLYDSRRFIYGSSAETFSLISQLISWGGDYQRANQFLQNEPDLSEKVAKLKAHQRLKYKTVNGLIIAASYIGAFEAATARSLMNVGADIVLVISNKKNELRGSARCKNNININVANLVTTLAREFEGEGGGHAMAAGFNIKRSLPKKKQAELINRFINLATQSIIPEN